MLIPALKLLLQQQLARFLAGDIAPYFVDGVAVELAYRALCRRERGAVHRFAVVEEVQDGFEVAGEGETTAQRGQGSFLHLEGAQLREGNGAPEFTVERRDLRGGNCIAVPMAAQ